MTMTAHTEKMAKTPQAMRAAMTLFLGALLCAAVALTGCSDSTAKNTGADTEVNTVRIGTMPTEDILPMWVAEDAGYFDELEFDVEIVSFDSAPALSAAITAGEVDMAMTDIMRAVKLTESGTPVVLEWVTLGTEADQGRFGILAAEDAPFDTLTEMADYAAAHPDEEVMVGVASNTVPEYVFDSLMQDAGLSTDAIQTTEIASLPDRFSLVASGNLAAAALPNSLLTLGEAQGMKVIADDTEGANISQSVMVAREDFADVNQAKILAIATVWDQAVDTIAIDPIGALQVLFANASMNAQTQDAYVLSAYPDATAIPNPERDSDIIVLAYPDEGYVTAQIEWMAAKGYGGEGVTYSATDGKLSR